ncbi:MAG: hypothetical protein AAGB00_04925 [Planctomycetota bacterium]
MQYTVRGVPEEVDKAARECAKREGLSLNEVLVRALRQSLGLEEKPTKKRDFASVFKGEPLEPEVLKALEEQRQIDWEMWPGLEPKKRSEGESA